PEGLLLLRPDALAAWTYAPPVVATAVQVGGRPRAGASQLAGLSLGASERSFGLDVAALDFTAPDQLAYRYRLQGFDAGWITRDAAHTSLAYTNLDPGSYTLRVQATNRAGLWSPHELHLPIVVLPAFYQTAWFRGALLAAALALVYAGYRL